MESVKKLPYTVAVKDTENTLENKKPCLAWTLFGLAVVTIVVIFVLLFWLNERNIQIEVTAVSPTVDEVDSLDRFECTCLKYPYNALYGKTPSNFLKWLVDGRFKASSGEFGSLYKAEDTFGYSSFKEGISLAVDGIAFVDPLDYSTDVSFNVSLGEDGAVAMIKEQIINDFLVQLNRLVPSMVDQATAYAVDDVCDLYPDVDCDIFVDGLRPPESGACGYDIATETSCLAEYMSTDPMGTCDGGNGTLPCETLLNMYHSAMPDQIAEALITTYLFPQVAVGGAGMPSGSMMMGDDPYSYVVDDDESYYYNSLSAFAAFGFFETDYGSFDDYTVEFKTEDCFQFTCTTVKTESFLSFLIRTASYTITAQGFVFLGAGILFKVCGGGKDDDGGKNGQQQGASAEVPLEDVDNDKDGLTGVIVDDVASTGRKSSSTSSSHNSGTTSSP